jgi:hypothetical protein
VQTKANTQGTLFKVVVFMNGKKYRKKEKKFLSLSVFLIDIPKMEN